MTAERGIELGITNRLEPFQSDLTKTAPIQEKYIPFYLK